MKKTHYLRYIAFATLMAFFTPTGYAQTDTLRAAVEAHPNDMDAHKAYLATFGSADEAQKQYEQWMKKFPKSANIPMAIAEKYGVYSPKRAGYLLEVVKRDPSRADAWEDLALDASIRGNKTKQKEYMERAMAADPQNLKLRASYVYTFSNDPEAFKQKAYDFVKKYPNSEETISVLNLSAVYLKTPSDKIEAGEKLRSLFPNSETVVFMVAMSRLADAYIQTRQYEKAIEVIQTFAEKAPERLHMDQKLRIAKTLAAVDSKMKNGQYEEAKDILMPLQVSTRAGIDVGSHVLLTKAAVLHAAGDTRSAYDSLIVFQAKTPIPEAQELLEEYGRTLGKSNIQVKEDIRAAIHRNAKPALPFELDSYASDTRVKLEDLKGKVVLLSFWYPGCGPCRGEMPHIEAGIKNIDKSKLAYIGVNILRDQDDFVKPFMQASGYSFTPLGASEAIIKDYNVQYAPMNFIIDQDGNIAYSHFMINTDNEIMLEMMIQSLL